MLTEEHVSAKDKKLILVRSWFVNYSRNGQQILKIVFDNSKILSSTKSQTQEEEWQP